MPSIDRNTAPELLKHAKAIRQSLLKKATDQARQQAEDLLRFVSPWNWDIHEDGAWLLDMHTTYGLTPNQIRRVNRMLEAAANYLDAKTAENHNALLSACRQCIGEEPNRSGRKPDKAKAELDRRIMKALQEKVPVDDICEEFDTHPGYVYQVKSRHKKATQKRET